MNGMHAFPTVVVRRVLPALRALACAVVVGTVVLLFWLRSAHARVGEALHGFGAELLDWHGAELHSAPRRLTVNGLALRLATASTRSSVREALERIQASCRHSGDAPPPEELLLRPAGESRPGPFDGTYLDVSESEGVVACVDSGRRLGLSELVDRLKAFS